MDIRKPVFHKKLVRFTKEYQILPVKQNVLSITNCGLYNVYDIDARKDNWPEEKDIKM